LARELIAYGISATPRGSGVVATVVASGARNDDQALGPRIVVDDAGTILPASARRAILALEVEPGTFGRPSSVPLFIAAEMAAAQGALLELSDALPETSAGARSPASGGGRGTGGGVRVIVTFPR